MWADMAVAIFRKTKKLLLQKMQKISKNEEMFAKNCAAKFLTRNFMGSVEAWY
jgi:hypothetical protein